MKPRQLPSGNWNVEVWNKYTGKRESITRTTKKELLHAEAIYYATLKFVPDMTFGEALDLYIESRTNVLKPSTIKSYKSYSRIYYDKLKPIPISKITDKILQKFVNEISVGHSPKTVNNIYGLIVSVIGSQAPNKTLNVTLPKKIKPNLHNLTQAEIDTLIAGIKDSQIETNILLAIFCCMRRAETCCITPQSVSGTPGNYLVHVQYSLSYNGSEFIKGSPKSYSGDRYIPCPDFLVEQIKKKPPHTSPKAVTSAFPKILKKLDLPQFRFHDLRHFSASKMLTLGIPLADVQKFGGWDSTSGTLERIYMYAMSESVQTSGQKWREYANTTNVTTNGK